MRRQQPPLEPSIRRAAIDDAATIADLHVRSWRVAYRDFLPADYLDALDAARHAASYWLPALQDPNPGSATWIAEMDGLPAGFVAVEGPQGVPPPEEALPGCGYVHHIHVAPEQLGRGVGAALWRTALDALFAAGYEEATLAVYEPNARARAFYEAHGWRTDGWSFRRAFPSAAGDVAVTMVRYRGPTGPRVR